MPHFRSRVMHLTLSPSRIHELVTWTTDWKGCGKGIEGVGHCGSGVGGVWVGYGKVQEGLMKSATEVYKGVERA